MKKIYLLISAFFLLTSISVENATAMKRRSTTLHVSKIPQRRCKKAVEDTQTQAIAPKASNTIVDAQTQTVEFTEPAASAEQHPSNNTATTQQIKVINTFVGPTSFTDWIKAEGIIEELKTKGIHDCLIRMLLTPQNILDSIFKQTIKLMDPLTDDTGIIIESVNINSVPLKIRPLLGSGFIHKGMTPLYFLNRICRYCQSTPSHYIVARIYIQRLIKKNTPNIFNNISFYRTYIAAFFLASKWLQDRIHPLKYYADVGGISKDELIKLEECFLNLIDFDIFVSPKEFKESFIQLINPS